MMPRLVHIATASALAALGLSATAVVARPSPMPNAVAAIQTADATARDFYVWYVALMAHDKEPSDEPAIYARFVSKALRAQIDRKMNSADGMDVDYFIKAQDYLDGWIGHVAVTPAAMHGAVARSVVTLGGGKPWRLAVSLAREDQRWKIIGVTKM